MTQGRLLSAYVGNVETQLRVKFAIGGAQAPAALRDHADAAPGAIGHFENFGQQLLRWQIAMLGDRARIGIVDKRLAGFELLDRPADALKHIKRLKASDHDRAMKAFC